MLQLKRRQFVYLILGLIAIAAFFPYESVVVPEWRLQVVDVEGTVCKDMPVNQSWGHYSLFLTGWLDQDERLSDQNGFVEFPERRVRATGVRRAVMPIITRALTLAHGGVGVSGTVSASGLKDVAWLSYEEGMLLPDKVRVEKCITKADLRPKSPN